jgi:hypothetical protein
MVVSAPMIKKTHSLKIHNICSDAYHCPRTQGNCDKNLLSLEKMITHAQNGKANAQKPFIYNGITWPYEAQ